MTLATDENKTDQNVVPLGKAAKKAVKGLAEKTGKPKDVSKPTADNKPKKPRAETAAETAERKENERKRLETAYADHEKHAARAKSANEDKALAFERVSSLVSKAAFMHEIKLRKMSAAEKQDFQGDLFKLAEYRRATELKDGASAMGKKGGSAK